MCGINGILSFGGAVVRSAELAAMRNTLVHRGPDGEGEWISDDARVGLAHRRLSIIDLSVLAAQPMSTVSGSAWIVFNGEIYNHAELRRELVQAGVREWRTDHSDTEVILHAYEKWGIECLKRFRGMFAFALWDARREQLWLVRDRIGVKPLYYSIVQGRVLFASEIKAILALPDVQRKVDHEALFHYLSFLTSPAPLTLFDGIYKLPPATSLCISRDGRMRQDRYWDVWDNVIPMQTEAEEVVAERLIEELRTSVRYRKVSDVPVGVFLSGGIDSSTNTALFSEGGGPVKTFSIGYDADYSSYPSELPFAARMARSVGAENIVKRLSMEDLFSFLPSMIYHQDEPIGDVVCVPLYYVAKSARDNGVVVCHVGEGADELFWGYPSWKSHLRIANLNSLPVPKFIKQLTRVGMSAAGLSETFPYECLRRATSGEPVFWGGAEGLTQAEKNRILSGSLRKQFAGFTSADALRPIYARFMAGAWERTPLNWMTYLDLNLRLPELLLMRVDKMTMATSLEARVPFLDHKFVEFAMGIPSAMKTRNGELKHILKLAVRGVIPDDLIYRKKQGFGVPLKDWLFDRLGDRIRQEVVRFAERTDILHPAEVSKYLGSAQPSKVWQLFNLALWHDRFIERRVQSPEADSPAAVLSAVD